MPRYRLTFGWTSDANASAHFRELKRRAVEAHDRDRELEFFAQEIRTARFHARQLPTWIPRLARLRFWFGLLYGTFSNFGRSFLRPLFFWLLLVVGFAAFYLGEHQAQRDARAALKPEGWPGTLSAYAATTSAAWGAPPPCVPSGAKVTDGTDALTEAVYLSFRNALVFDAGRGDTARRTYGCLYGFEPPAVPAGAPPSPNLLTPPVVPLSVAVASTVQTLLSGLLIFLFLLAVRNLLRLK